jgi:hypothetical protein
MKLYFSTFFNLKAAWMLLLPVFYPALSLYAGENGNIVSTIKFEAKLNHSLNKNLIDNFWNPGTGIEVIAEFPFYTGITQAGFSVKKYKGIDNEYPSFTGNYLFICMGGETKLPGGIELFAGLKAGYFLMTFDDDTLTSYQKFESELMAGVNFRLSYPVTENLYLSASSDISVLMTHDKLKFYSISAGIAYKFKSPQWVKDIFN